MNYCIIFVLPAFISLSFSQESKGKLRFVVLGDFGGIPVRPYSRWSQRLVSKKISEIPNVNFFVTTGDNFYFRGVNHVDDFRFFATYERIYSYPSLQKKWYVVAGNHDYYGNVSAQILYTQKSNRWTFPHFYHTKVFSIPESNKTLQIILIDTMSLCFTRIPKRKNAPSAETQMEWIKNTLNESKSDYLIVVGHHPMFSAGRHGNNKCLQGKLQNLFKHHKVNAYISGHDHNLQHIVPENSSLEHFVCGSSNFFHDWQINRPFLEPNSLKTFIGNYPGFLLATAKDDRLKFELRTIKPKQKYKRLLQPRSKLHEFTDGKYSKLLEDFFKSLQHN